ncbi:MAG TPA: hypothetical protein VII61_09810 [Ktedonobacteraceae bacterium]
MPDDSTLAFLLTNELQQAFQTWDRNQPARTGLHASSVLESDADFCTRQHVLAEQFPDERQQKEQYWKVLAMFANGWSIHKKWQEDLLYPTGMVVLSEVEAHDMWNPVLEAELDRTHIHQETGIQFSPDAIIDFAGQRMVVEIKGINHEDFQGCVDKPLSAAANHNKSIRSAIPQLNLYLHLLGLQKGIILAEDKNTQDFMIWIWTYDPEMSIKPLTRAIEVRTWIKLSDFNAGELPHRICSSINDSRAKRCPFRDACFRR